MTTDMLALCWKYPAETAAERLILLKIGDVSDDNGRSIYFSMETYAKAGLLKTTDGARKIIRRLEEKQILLEDPDMEATLRNQGELIRARVYRLNIEKIKAAIKASKANPAVIDAYRRKEGEDELSSSSETSHEHELSSVSDDGANTNSVRSEHELSSPNTFLESSASRTPIIPLSEIKDDFQKLFDAWSPFEMTKGDYGQGERKYTEIRETGVTAEDVAKAARVYCQQCSVTRCKTKHIENWLRSCVWRPEAKGLGEGANGRASASKRSVQPVVPRVYVAVDSQGREHAQWPVGDAPSHHAVESQYPGCRLRIRDMTADEISTTQGGSNDKNQVSA